MSKAKVTPGQAKVAEQHGIHITTVYSRLHYGWDIETAITTPPTTNTSEINKGNRSNSWYSTGVGALLKCPVDGCEHTGNIITKVHCRTAHGMERVEVGKQYGMPYKVGINMQKRFENLKEGFK